MRIPKQSTGAVCTVPAMSKPVSADGASIHPGGRQSPYQLVSGSQIPFVKGIVLWPGVCYSDLVGTYPCPFHSQFQANWWGQWG